MALADGYRTTQYPEESIYNLISKYQEKPPKPARYVKFESCRHVPFAFQLIAVVTVFSERKQDNLSFSLRGFKKYNLSEKPIGKKMKILRILVTISSKKHCVDIALCSFLVLEIL